ncbi:MAG: hypothetical protein HDP34_00990 [Clostridia bacterium]|nr:hypothetical protein [Clostridia bacterium]
MMKVHNKMLIMIMLLIAVLTGCGKNKDGVEVQENDNANFKVQVDTLIDKENDSEVEEDYAEQMEKETVDEPVKFDCIDAIKNASPESGLLQIDDMILQYGAKCSEIISVIEQSECIYEADFNAHSVVPAGSSVGIRFYKGGEQYFILRAINREAETVELNDCVIYSISVLDSAMGSAYYAGFGDDEMTYTTVKEAMKGYEPEKELFGGSDSRGNKELGVLYTVPFQEGEAHLYFIFDGITNKLITFEINEHSYDSVSWPW